MLDMAVELDKFRQDMRLRGRPEDIISVVVEAAQTEIVQAVDAAINSHMDEARAEGLAKGVDDFVDQLRATRLGTSYNITTDSGQTDFTVPPFPMLPKLLKNAKVAKDGSLYKVIPVKQKPKKQARTTVEIMQQMNESRRISKEEKRAKKDSSGEVNFRTASSKQDASTKWVHPGKEGDMTQKLRDINARLGLVIDRIIQDTIDKHRGDWA